MTMLELAVCRLAQLQGGSKGIPFIPQERCVQRALSLCPLLTPPPPPSPLSPTTGDCPHRGRGVARVWSGGGGG